MERYIGDITEETWPDARAILDAFRVGYRTSPDSEGWCNVWVEAEDFADEPWWEELLEAKRDKRIVWEAADLGCGEPVL